MKKIKEIQCYIGGRGGTPGICREMLIAAYLPRARAVQAGIDRATLAAMLGHSKINMVLRYAHPTQEHQTKAMDKMEEYVSQRKIAQGSTQHGKRHPRSNRGRAGHERQKARHSLQFPLQRAMPRYRIAF